MEDKKVMSAAAVETQNDEKQQAVVLTEEFEMDFRTTEAYKTLRANLEFSGEDVKVIAVTSCTPNEGKSKKSVGIWIKSVM